MSPLSISRFPDELVIEIFRDQCFSTRDLTRLALVSRRFLPSVQRSLYVSVTLALAPLEEEDDEGPDLAYTVKSWKLLKVLEEHEHLASLVDEVRYMHEWTRKHDDTRISRIVTTFENALASFLRLARNTTSFSAYEAVPPGNSYLEIIANYGPQITKLKNPFCTCANRRGSTETTRKITHLTVWQVSSSLPEEVIFPNLTYLDLQAEDLERVQIHFFDPVFPKLEVLKVNVAIAVTLDYSTMPHLHYLHLYANDSSLICLPETPDFWYTLSRSPSIRTLSFDCLPFRNGFETHIFNYGLGWDALIPSLRTIRFDREIRLDRAQFIFRQKLSSTLTRFVVTSSRENGVRPVGSHREREIRALVGLCEGTGIQVMLEDAEEMLWNRIFSLLTIRKFSTDPKHFVIR
ncbi:hypothetical protein JCM5353_008047 [Sporobolomyces roseus]